MHAYYRPHKRCWFILTAGRWPWKLEPAKECVTTHLPNEPALKMDGAEACFLYTYTRPKGRSTTILKKRKKGGKTPPSGLPRAPCRSGRGTGRQAGQMRAGGRLDRRGRRRRRRRQRKRRRETDGTDRRRAWQTLPQPPPSLSLYIVLLVFVVPLLILLLPRSLSSPPLLPFFPYARRSTQMSFRVGGREVCDEGFTRKGDWNRLQC